MTGKVALVCGAGGFIGHHLVRRLKREGFWVRGTDLKFPRFSETEADDFMIGDLRDPYFVRHVIDRRFDEIYQLAADMGGAGYIFTGEHDADVMHNSASINLNILHAAHARNNKRIFYSSSACMYPEYNQLDPDNPNCAEVELLSGRTGQRVRLGEAVQRAALPRLWPQSWHGSSDCSLPQYFRAGGELERRQGEGSGGRVPQSCDGVERGRDRDLG